MAGLKFPSLMAALALVMGGVFGEHNHPIMTARVGALLMEGIPICANPGLFAGIACSQIRTLAADVQNIEEKEDGSMIFSILRYKHNRPSDLYVASRGTNGVGDLGRIHTFNGSSHLNYWVNEVDEEGKEISSVCNMINGTDSGIFPPFVNRDKSLYAFNTDVCRSVELRYQEEVVYQDSIPAARFTANSWFLDNHQGCFCLNTTEGITRDDGCLLSGAIEMLSCVGALMAMSYPHFLYAHSAYRNGVIGLVPNEEAHRIFVDLEPLGLPEECARETAEEWHKRYSEYFTHVIFFTCFTALIIYMSISAYIRHSNAKAVHVPILIKKNNRINWRINKRKYRNR